MDKNRVTDVFKKERYLKMEHYLKMERYQWKKNTKSISKHCRYIFSKLILLILGIFVFICRASRISRISKTFKTHFKNNTPYP